MPTGIAMFPGAAELLVPSSFAERCYTVVRFSEMPSGGHFPALEKPALLVAGHQGILPALRDGAGRTP